MILTLCLFSELLFNCFVKLTKMIGNKFNNSLGIGVEKISRKPYKILILILSPSDLQGHDLWLIIQDNPQSIRS